MKLDSKRQCSSCQFFQEAQLSGNGWCTHPKRQVASDLKILVRAKEIACRNTWGDDLWSDAALSGATTPPQSATPRKGISFANQRFEDEVTSVVDSTAGKAGGHESDPGVNQPDDMVVQTSVRADDAAPAHPRSIARQNDHNAAAIADQDERVRRMARGSRDAIFYARERVMQRRAPTRSTIEPDSGIDQTASARASDVRNRELHAHGPADTSDQNRGGVGRPTPPVPRSEVEARGDALSPAAGADVRFDSIPVVRPEVDLPRLREFFRTDPALKRGNEKGAAPLSSFDLVLQRAKQIQAAGAIGREDSPNPPARPVAAPRRAARDFDPDRPTIRSNANVVWDVEGDRLNVAFERARAAIDERPSAPGDELAPYAVDLDYLVIADAAPASFDSSFSDEPDFEVDFDDTNAIALHNGEIDDHDTIDGQQSLADDWYDDGYSVDTYIRNGQKESPRTSWWRALNFGMRRRYHDVVSQGGAVSSAVYDETVAFEGDYEYPEYYRAPSDSDWDDPSWEPADPFASVSRSEPLPHAATSRQSWLEDEYEFPDPQPAAWSEARAVLMARPAEFALSAAQPAPGHSNAPSEVADQNHHHDDAVAELTTSRRPEPTFFAIDEPGGMDAFRSALFGTDDTSPPLFEPFEVGTCEPRVNGGDRRSVDSSTGRGTAVAVLARPGQSTLPRGHHHQLESTHTVRKRVLLDSGFDLSDALADREEEPDRVFEVASRVPKSCSTCRSFRPSETGDRGRCMNHDAPTYRQMVNASELTCRSSIGFWWLAADTSWIPPASAIRPETPRTDRLVAHSVSLNKPERHDDRRVRTRIFDQERENSG